MSARAWPPPAQNREDDITPEERANRIDLSTHWNGSQGHIRTWNDVRAEIAAAIAEEADAAFECGAIAMRSRILEKCWGAYDSVRSSEKNKMPLPKWPDCK